MKKRNEDFIKVDYKIIPHCDVIHEYYTIVHTTSIPCYHAHIHSHTRAHRVHRRICKIVKQRAHKLILTRCAE